MRWARSPASSDIPCPRSRRGTGPPGRCSGDGPARVWTRDPALTVQLSGPLLAASMVVATLATLEGGARLRLDETKRAELPHVGVGAEMQQRLHWVERGRTRVEESSDRKSVVRERG